MGVDGDSARHQQYRTYLDTELEAAAIYSALADVDRDSGRAAAFDGLMQAEMRHAARWAEKLGIDPAGLEPSSPNFKVRLVRLGARLIGTRRVLPVLLRMESQEMSAYAADPEARDMAKEERHHARLLRDLAKTGPVEGGWPTGRGVLGSGGALRAAVLGVNDGLVSNFSLVMGVAGGTGDPDLVLLAGVAGLLAGSFSMAAGEYVSMRSQRDIYEHQIRKQEIELREWPEAEEEELALIYQAKGLSPQESRRVAKRVMSDPRVALDTMAREHLGLDPSDLGSPWGASVSSFAAFVGGAVVPILPYIFGAGNLALPLSAGLSAGALIAVGSLLSSISGKSAVWGGLRMLLAGGAAATVTFGIGSLIGVAVID